MSGSEFYAIVVIALIILFLKWLLSAVHVPRAHWHHTFDFFQFSPTEFYKAATESVGRRALPKVSISETVHNEGSIIDPSRKYLRVKRGDYLFDICAAPFGTGYFVSWRLIEEFGLKKRIYRKFPFIAAWFNVQTYYTEDTEITFRDLVHAGVLEAIETMSGTQGFRALSDLERQIPPFQSKR